MMRLTKFRYVAPKTLKEALSVLADEGPTACILAGGTDLLPNMKRRHQTPQTLVSLRRIPSLKNIQGSPSKGMSLGPLATLTEVCTQTKIRDAYPALARAVEDISTPILRNMGTIGGNVCLDTRCNYYNQNYEWRRGIHFCLKRPESNAQAICWVAPSSPTCLAVHSSDSVPVLCALGAQYHLQSREGERVIPAWELYQKNGLAYLTKRPDEVLTAIDLPPPQGCRATYLKLRRRGAFDFPVLGVAVAVWREKGKGIVEQAKIFLNAVASAPLEAVQAEEVLKGQPLTDETIQQAADLAHQIAKPLDNTDFSMYWRKDMVRVFVRRALSELA